MWQVVGAVLQIIMLFLKNKFEKDKELQEKKRELKEEAIEAVKSKDPSRLNALINKLREE